MTSQSQEVIYYFPKQENGVFVNIPKTSFSMIASPEVTLMIIKQLNMEAELVKPKEPQQMALVLKISSDDIENHGGKLLKVLDDAGVNYNFHLCDFKALKNKQVNIKI